MTIFRLGLLGLIFGGALAWARPTGAVVERMGAEVAGVRSSQAPVPAHAVSRGAAIAEAARHFVPGPGVSVDAKYGVLSDDQMYTQRPGVSERNYTAQNRPVWLITYSGMSIPSRGPGPIVYDHELNVVVDAATGTYLYAYSYR